MKVLFLYVNSCNLTGIPIGLSYLISILKQRGHEISLFDTTFFIFNYSEFNISGRIGGDGWEIIKGFREYVAKVKPDLIGVSCASLQLNFAVRMVESLQNRPTTVFGGVGPTVDYSNLIKNQIVDYVCVGFGEECLPLLINNLEKKINLSDISNLVYKLNGKTRVNKFSQKMNLANLPLPDWSLFPEQHFPRIFKYGIKRWGNFQLTRGCPFNCSYCVNYFYHKELGMKIQRFPFEKIVREMKILSQKYDLEILRIFDECFGFGNMNYYRKFGKLYKQTLSLPTIIETRPEAITPELIGVLKDMNCISVSIGIEVGNENQRKEMLNRNVSNCTIKRAFELLHEAGIRASSYNMMGFPNDTRELIFETIRLNQECKPDFISTFIVCPEPKTKLREYCKKHDLLDTEATVHYTLRSVIKNEKLSKDELWKIYRSFTDYVRQPERKAEIDERNFKSTTPP